MCLDYDNRDSTATFECNGCGEVETLHGYSFTDAIRRIKELGWRILKGKVPDEWEHFCPGCES